MTFDPHIPDDVRAAALECVQFVDAYEDDDATRVFEALAKRVAADRELALATHRALAAGFRSIYNGDWTSRALRAALDIAAADTTPQGVARWIELSIEAAIALENELMDEDTDRVIDDLVTRVGPDAAFAIRLRLADAFTKASEARRAGQQLQAALELELGNDDRVDVLLRLADWRSHLEPDEKAAIVTEIAALLAAGVTSVERQIRAHLALSANLPSAALAHAATAAELAGRCTDLVLRRQALEVHAEWLFDAGDLAGAEAIVATLPPPATRDDAAWDGIAEPAFLEDIQRRRGLRGEPPPEAFAELPVESESPVFASSSQALPEGFAAYFTPGDVLTLVREGRLVSPEIVREWSHGAIRSAADLDSEKIFGPLRSYACHCGRFLGNRYRGIVCHKCGVEVISRASRAVRPAHLQLPRPVVHPWYVPVVAQVLELAQPAVKAADSELLRDRLRDVDIRWSAERLRNTLADPIGARRRAEATARLELLDALVGATIRPEWFVLELVPVWPPEAELPPPLESAALRTCYVDILEPPDLAQAVRRLFNYVGRQAKAAS